MKWCRRRAPVTSGRRATGTGTAVAMYGSAGCGIARVPATSTTVRGGCSTTVAGTIGVPTGGAIRIGADTTTTVAIADGIATTAGMAAGTIADLAAITTD